MTATQNNFKKSCILILTTFAFFIAPLSAKNNVEKATLQAALMLKLLPYYTNLEGKKFRIHVIGDELVANQLQTQLGKKFGQATLEHVTSGAGLPEGEVDVIFWGAKADPHGIVNKKGVLSISGDASFVENGATLGIVLNGNERPKILLNLASSKTEGASWKPAILKVAETL